MRTTALVAIASTLITLSAGAAAQAGGEVVVRRPTEAAIASARRMMQTHCDGQVTVVRESGTETNAAEYRVNYRCGRASTATPARTVPARGGLQVDTVPESRVFVDGRYVGRTPLEAVQLTPGRHRVRLQTDDGQSFDTTVTIRAGITARIRQRLRR